MEVWKDIKGFEKYEISNLGRVRRLYKQGYKYRKPVSQNGYNHVTLSKNGAWSKFQIHRLVAELFIPNPKNKPCVNHKNGIKTDNKVENLEWCTHSENEQHSYDVLGKITNGLVRRKIPLSEIQEIKEMYKNGITQKEISKIYDVSISTISLIVNNKTYVKHV